MNNLRILVTTDFSANSYNAFNAAKTIAELFNGTISTLFVSEPKNDLMISDIIPGYSADSNLSAKERLTKYLSSLSKEKLGDYYSGESFVESGYPSTIIAKKANTFDMLVMASHGRSRLSRLLVGSVTEKVIHEVNIPVLIVKKDQNKLDLSKIMVTSDMSFHSTLAFPYAEKIGYKATSYVDLVHAISYENFEWLSQIQNFIREQKSNLDTYKKEYFSRIADNVQSKLLYSNRSIHDELIRQINEEKYGLIIMATLGKTGLDYLRLGSTSYNILRYSNTPILLIPGKKVT